MNYKRFITALIFLSILGLQRIQAQNNHKFNSNQTYTIGVANPFWAGGGGDLYSISIKPDKNTKKIYPSNYLNKGSEVSSNSNFVYLEGAKNIKIYTGIRPSLFKDYRYRIILDDTLEIVHWQTPSADSPILKSNYIFNPSNQKIIKIDTEYVSTRLASLNCKNKKITMQMYNINFPNDVFTLYIYNKLIPKPKILGVNSVKILRTDEGLNFYTMSFQIGLHEGERYHAISIDSIYQVQLLINKTDAQMIYQIYVKNISTKKEKVYRIPTHWQPAKVYNKDTSDIKVETSKQAYPTVTYSSTMAYSSIIPKYIFSKPGEYQITIIPELPSDELKYLFKDKAATASFTILPTSQESFTLRQIAPCIGISVFVLGIGFWQYKRYQNRKFSKEILQKEMTKTRLASILSQLNPHFMFNALSSIQNLMNKKEIDKANRYLGKFSRLTRNVLEGTENDLISISDEKMLLDDYLQMEQLRFGFQYTIDIDKSINNNTIEIPAMLLQPFVENAVKHGIAMLKSKGKIQIHFIKNKDSLLIQIMDNGGGFESNKKYEGFGLRLSQKRIDLLNDVYKESPITLKIQSNINGTVVSMTLNNWI